MRPIGLRTVISISSSISPIGDLWTGGKSFVTSLVLQLDFSAHFLQLELQYVVRFFPDSNER